MKIKLDENLPVSLVSVLSKYGFDVETVFQEGLSGHCDDDVWKKVCEESRFLVTQDMDFSDIRKFKPGTHPGIMLVRLMAPGRLELVERIENVFSTSDVTSWEKCFVVVTDRKIRIHFP